MFTVAFFRWLSHQRVVPVWLYIVVGLLIISLPNSLYLLVLLPIDFALFIPWLLIKVLMKGTASAARTYSRWETDRRYQAYQAKKSHPRRGLTRGEVLAIAQSKLAEARIFAQDIEDEDLREAFVAEAELKYRETLANLLNA